MRNLLITIGAPGSGKSTWIKENNLEQFTICPDNMRLIAASPEMNLDGSYVISGKNDKNVWAEMYNKLDERMSNGHFTVIDATHTRPDAIKKYEDLCEKYRYRLYGVRFDVDAATLIARNSSRGYKSVPEDVILTHEERMKSLTFNSGITIINKNELFKINEYNNYIDFNHFKNIHVIGDIHGVYEPIEEYMNKYYNNEDGFIFVGDYIDRGNNNYKVMNLLLSLKDKPNVTFLEGNHERWTWLWATNQVGKINSDEFLKNSMIDFKNNNLSQKEVRVWHRKLRLFASFIHNNRKFLVTHGGVSTDKIDFIAANQLINGVGKYEDSDYVDHKFCENTNSDTYTIHGHRNVYNSQIQSAERAYNLEGKIEFGGHLRSIIINKNEIVTVQIKSNYVNMTNKHSPKPTPKNWVEELRNCSLVKERKFDDNISSFNFTREAFYDKKWDEINIKARGLFINTQTNEIVIRSYNKFFNYLERPETSDESLMKNLKFPVNVYLKENGYLGLIGYDSTLDKIYISSKSTFDGDSAFWFQDLVLKLKLDINKMHTITKNNKTLVFEVILPEKDPHIIKQEKDKVVLLDVINRTKEFNKLNYNELINISKELNIECKKLYTIINNFDELKSFINEYSNNMDHEIEGFVLEDQNNFMLKLKTPYYNFWKYMRMIKDSIYKGKEIDMNKLENKAVIDFINWLKSIDFDLLDKSIIDLRDMYNGR